MKSIDQKRILSLPYPLTLRVAEVTASTNDDLKAEARAEAKDYTVRIADRQLAGKGRKQRAFFSEGGLYMSVLLPAKDNLDLLTCIAAVAVATAIREVTGEEARIKWVNDVYVKGKKVCGILSESVVTEGKRRVIVGIGVNLNTPEEAFPEEIRGIAGSVVADRSVLAASILNHLLCRFEKEDTASVCEEYKKLCFLTGQKVTVRKENGCREATVLGLTDSLALSVLYPDGQKEDLIAGEVSLQVQNR